MSGAHEGLRTGLAGLAEEVQLVDLRAGTRREARRLRRLRAAAGAGIAAVVLAAGGGAALAVLPQRRAAPAPPAAVPPPQPPAVDAVPGIVLYDADNSPDHELWRRPSGGQWQRIGTTNRPSGADWLPSPDGRSVAYIDQGRLWIRDIDSGARADVTAAAATSTCGGLAWSGDSRRIVLMDGADLVAVDRDGGKPRPVATGLCAARRPVASADGRFVAMVSGGEPVLVPVDGSGARTVAAHLPAGQAPSTVVAVANGGARLLLATEPTAASECCNRYRYWLLDAATGRTTALSAPTEQPMSGGFAPDGRAVLLTAPPSSSDGGRTAQPTLTAYAQDGSRPSPVELPRWVYQGLVLEVTDR